MPWMAPERVWNAISTKSPVESSCCNCSNPPLIEIDCSFARSRRPPSAITAAATDPWSCTRGERWLALDWGKWVIANWTMPCSGLLSEITKAPVHERMLGDQADLGLPVAWVCDNKASNFFGLCPESTLVQ